MQLIARANRGGNNANRDGEKTSEVGNSNALSSPGGKDGIRQSSPSPDERASKLYRKLGMSRKGDSPLRKLQHQWALLSVWSKIASFVVLLYLIQHVVFGCMTSIAGFMLKIHVETVAPTLNFNQEITFAVVINTFKRPAMLQQAVRHYAETCGRRTGVSQVFIVWAEQNAVVPTPESFFESSSSFRRSFSKENRATVKVLEKDKDSLNSRFEPIPELESSAIFMVDDDIAVSCHSLFQGFEAWRNRPDAMVGYYPRLATPPRRDPAEKSNDLTYHAWPEVYLRHSFNLVLTKASFLHSKYLEIYSNDDVFPKAFKLYIDQRRNCEDIAMSMLVANYTRYRLGEAINPVFVEGSVSDKGLFGGISTGSGHMVTRSDCLSKFNNMFVELGWGEPLNVTAPLGSNSWIQYKPGIWWQYRPSNFFEWFAISNLFS